MGTPEFAVPALDALIHSDHEVVGVFAQPDLEAEPLCRFGWLRNDLSSHCEPFSELSEGKAKQSPFPRIAASPLASQRVIR